MADDLKDTASQLVNVFKDLVVQLEKVSGGTANVTASVNKGVKADQALISITTRLTNAKATLGTANKRLVDAEEDCITTGKAYAQQLQQANKEMSDARNKVTDLYREQNKLNKEFENAREASKGFGEKLESTRNIIISTAGAMTKFAAGFGLVKISTQECVDALMKIEGATLKLSQTNRVFAGSSEDVKEAMSKIRNTTVLTEQQFASMATQMQITWTGVRPPVGKIVKWAESMKYAFTSAEELSGAMANITSATSKMPNIFDRITAVQQAYNKSVKQGDAAAASLQSTLNQLGVAGTQLTDIMRAAQTAGKMSPEDKKQAELQIARADVTKSALQAQKAWAVAVRPLLLIVYKVVNKINGVLESMPTSCKQIVIGIALITAAMIGLRTVIRGVSLVKTLSGVTDLASGLKSGGIKGAAKSFFGMGTKEAVKGAAATGGIGAGIKSLLGFGAPAAVKGVEAIAPAMAAAPIVSAAAAFRKLKIGKAGKAFSTTKLATKPLRMPKLGKSAKAAKSALASKAVLAKGASSIGGKAVGAASSLLKMAKGGITKVPIVGSLLSGAIEGHEEYANRKESGQSSAKAAKGAAMVGGGAAIGAMIGAAVGTLKIPIPILGTLVGGMIGASIGKWAGSAAAEATIGSAFEKEAGNAPTIGGQQYDKSTQKFGSEFEDKFKEKGGDVEALKSKTTTTAEMNKQLKILNETNKEIYTANGLEKEGQKVMEAITDELGKQKLDVQTIQGLWDKTKVETGLVLNATRGISSAVSSVIGEWEKLGASQEKAYETLRKMAKIEEQRKLSDELAAQEAAYEAIEASMPELLNGYVKFDKNTKDITKDADYLAEAMERVAQKHADNGEADKQAEVLEITNKLLEADSARQKQQIIAGQQSASILTAEAKAATTQLDKSRQMIDLRKGVLNAMRPGFGMDTQLLLQQIAINDKRKEYNALAAERLSGQSDDNPEAKKIQEMTTELFGSKEAAKDFFDSWNPIEKITDKVRAKMKDVKKETAAILLLNDQYKDQKMEELKIEKENLDLTKDIREGYLDAIKQSIFNGGEWNKIIGTQEYGVTQIIDKQKELNKVMGGKDENGQPYDYSQKTQTYGGREDADAPAIRIQARKHAKRAELIAGKDGPILSQEDEAFTEAKMGAFAEQDPEMQKRMDNVFKNGSTGKSKRSGQVPITSMANGEEYLNAAKADIAKGGSVSAMLNQQTAMLNQQRQSASNNAESTAAPEGAEAQSKRFAKDRAFQTDRRSNKPVSTGSVSTAMQMGTPEIQKGESGGEVDEELRKSVVIIKNFNAELGKLQDGMRTIREIGSSMKQSSGDLPVKPQVLYNGAPVGEHFATGGIVGLGSGKRRGEDTVPTMLAPGEVVFNPKKKKHPKEVRNAIEEEFMKIQYASNGVIVNYDTEDQKARTLALSREADRAGALMLKAKTNEAKMIASKQYTNAINELNARGSKLAHTTEKPTKRASSPVAPVIAPDTLKQKLQKAEDERLSFERGDAPANIYKESHKQYEVRKRRSDYYKVRNNATQKKEAFKNEYEALKKQNETRQGMSMKDRTGMRSPHKMSVSDVETDPNKIKQRIQQTAANVLRIQNARKGVSGGSSPAIQQAAKVAQKAIAEAKKAKQQDAAKAGVTGGVAGMDKGAIDSEIASLNNELNNGATSPERYNWIKKRLAQLETERGISVGGGGGGGDNAPVKYDAGKDTPKMRAPEKTYRKGIYGLGGSRGKTSLRQIDRNRKGRLHTREGSGQRYGLGESTFNSYFADGGIVSGNMNDNLKRSFDTNVGGSVDVNLSLSGKAAEMFQSLEDNVAELSTI